MTTQIFDEEDFFSIARKLKAMETLSDAELDSLIVDSIKTKIETNSTEIKQSIEDILDNKDPLIRQNARDMIVDYLGKTHPIELGYQKPLPAIVMGRGARVKISAKSKYAHQNKGVGTMQGDFTKDPDSWVEVIFDDGYKNSYNRSDLVSELKPSQLEKIARKNQERSAQASRISFTEFRAETIQQIFSFINKSGDSVFKGDFSEGAEVEMTAEADKHYDLSKKGSEGKIVKHLGGDSYRVHFTKLTGAPRPDWQDNTFEVLKSTMKLKKSLKEKARENGGEEKYAEMIFDEATKEVVAEMNQTRVKKDLRGSLTKILTEKGFARQENGTLIVDKIEVTKLLASRPAAYEVVRSLFSEGMYAPFAERRENVVQFELTTGCSHNRCTFCDMYRTKHEKKGVSDGERHICDVLGSIPSGMREGLERIFIANGDALSIDVLALSKLIQHSVREFRKKVGRLPRRIAAFASTQNILKQQYEGLKFLNCGGTCHRYFDQPNTCSVSEFGTKTGLSLVYWGIESGADSVLDYVGKGCTRKDHVKAGELLSEAGIRTSVTIIPGLGGTKYAQDHLTGTVEVLNRLRPNFITLTAIDVSPTSVYARRMADEKKNRPLNDRELAEQTLSIFEGLTFSTRVGCYDSQIQRFGKNPFPFGAYEIDQWDRSKRDKFVREQRKRLAETRFADGS